MKVDVEKIAKKYIQKPIYKVIDASFFEEMDISPQDFLDLGKNSNQPQFILYKVGVVLKIKGYGKIFYAQMFMIR